MNVHTVFTLIVCSSFTLSAGRLKQTKTRHIWWHINWIRPILPLYPLLFVWAGTCASETAFAPSFFVFPSILAPFLSFFIILNVIFPSDWLSWVAMSLLIKSTPIWGSVTPISTVLILKLSSFQNTYIYQVHPCSVCAHLSHSTVAAGICNFHCRHNSLWQLGSARFHALIFSHSLRLLLLLCSPNKQDKFVGKSLLLRVIVCCLLWVTLHPLW